MADEGAGDGATPPEVVTLPTGVEDISETSDGQDAIDAMAARDDVNANKYVALTNVPGDDPDALWVIPEGAAMPQVTVMADGSVDMETEDGPPSGAIDDGDSRSPHASKVSWFTPKCYARYKDIFGWFDHCSQWATVDYDHDGNRDHYLFYQYGTCKSYEQWYLTSCLLKDHPTDSSPNLFWEDWAPRSDSNAGCRTQSLNVSIKGIGVGGSYTACEQIDITKYNEDGKFANEWKGAQYQHERDVQYRVTFGVANGRIPSLHLHWDLDGVVLI